jgi:tryptophan halogenase
MDTTAKRFNERFAYRWERVVEFLKLHYVLSGRADSDYWQDNRLAAGIPARLQEALDLWRYQPPSRHDLYQVEEIFPAASYHYVLYGMGFLPAVRPTTRRREHSHEADPHFQTSASLAAKYLGGLPSNREMLEHVRRQGMHTI